MTKPTCKIKFKKQLFILLFRIFRNPECHFRNYSALIQTIICIIIKEPSLSSYEDKLGSKVVCAK